MDLLGDLNLGQQPVMSAPQKQTSVAVDLLGDLFGSPPPEEPKTFGPVQFYNKNGLLIQFMPFKESSTVTQVKAVFKSQVSVQNIGFQIAVPKVFLV
jgi:hypothetical protein